MAEDRDPEEPTIDEQFTHRAKSHNEYAEAYRLSIENLENQLNHARMMQSIHSDAADTLHKLAHVARDRIADHHAFLNRNEPVQAETVKRNY